MHDIENRFFFKKIIINNKNDSIYSLIDFFFRGVVTDSKDNVKSAADGLGRNGFINYFGLQVNFR